MFRRFSFHGNKDYEIFLNLFFLRLNYPLHIMVIQFISRIFCSQNDINFILIVNTLAVNFIWRIMQIILFSVFFYFVQNYFLNKFACFVLRSMNILWWFKSLEFISYFVHFDVCMCVYACGLEKEKKNREEIWFVKFIHKKIKVKIKFKINKNWREMNYFFFLFSKKRNFIHSGWISKTGYLKLKKNTTTTTWNDNWWSSSCLEWAASWMKLFWIEVWSEISNQKAKWISCIDGCCWFGEQNENSNDLNSFQSMNEFTKRINCLKVHSIHPRIFQMELNFPQKLTISYLTQNNKLFTKFKSKTLFGKNVSDSI